MGIPKAQEIKQAKARRAKLLKEFKTAKCSISEFARGREVSRQWMSRSLIKAQAEFAGMYKLTPARMGQILKKARKT